MREEIHSVLTNLASNASSKIPIPAHPYYPLEVEIVGYLANEWSVPVLLGVFFGGCAILMLSTHVFATKQNPQLAKSEITTISWFVLSGSIHLFFEGYYSVNHAAMGGLQTLFGQLWKEYALSDSRYLTQDPFVLCMETVTAFSWGPLCFLVAYLITRDHPLRHPFQIIVSLGQFYGDVLYYATSMFDHYRMNITYSRPEAYYFWGYYFLMNFFWILIPGYLIYSSVGAIANTFRKLNKLEQASSSANGNTNNGHTVNGYTKKNR